MVKYGIEKREKKPGDGSVFQKTEPSPFLFCFSKNRTVPFSFLFFKKQNRPHVSLVFPERGAILLMVLIIILTISLLGATLMALFFNVLSLNQIELDRTRALYLAEAGIAVAIGTLKNQAGAVRPSADSAAQSEMIVPPTKLEGGYFEVYNDYSQSTIVSIGKSSGVKRTIQVRYNAF